MKTEDLAYKLQLFGDYINICDVITMLTNFN